MDRRDLLKMIAAATGVAMVGGDLWAADLKSADAGKALFTQSDIAFLDEIAEIDQFGDTKLQASFNYAFE